LESLDSLISLYYEGTTQLSLFQTVINFFLCIGMGFVIRAFYISRSYSLTGKSHIGSILPILSAVVFLVILVVKSSLALSLGLVGALSIVRFRTPIKEPEELVYLFLAIALGLGYGAGQVLLTTICIVIILIVIYLWLSNRSIRKTYEYNMVINWNDENLEFNSILQEIEPRLLSLKLIRLDYGDSNNTAVLLIEPNENEDIDSIINDLKGKIKDFTCSFFEAKNNW